MPKITVFLGKSCELRRFITDYTPTIKFTYKRREGDPTLSASDFILYCLGRRSEGGFIDEVATDAYNGDFSAVIFDDFVAYVDESVNLKPYFDSLLSIGNPILYFAERESSVKRLKDIAEIIVYEEKEF